MVQDYVDQATVRYTHVSDCTVVVSVERGGSAAALDSGAVPTYVHCVPIEVASLLQRSKCGEAADHTSAMHGSLKVEIVVVLVVGGWSTGA